MTAQADFLPAAGKPFKRAGAAAKVPRALAIFNSGNALATVVAAPLGSYLASFIGWRGAFFCLVPVGVLVVTRVDVPTLSAVLLVVGVAGFVGTVVIGRFLNAGFYATLTFIPMAMAAIALALIAAGASVAATAVLLGIWGMLGTAAPVGWWTWLARTLPRDVEAGGGLMVADVQLSIASGSAAGGTLFDGVGYQGAFAASAGILVVAALLVSLTARAARTDAQ